MKIKHILSCMLLCTVLNISNGYTADKYIYIPNSDKLNGKTITIYDSYDNKFHNTKMYIYTKPDKDFKTIEVHKYFGDPNSDTLTVTKNQYGQFQPDLDADLQKRLSDFSNKHHNVRYGIATYNDANYLIKLCNNSVVDGQVFSTVVCGVKCPRYVPDGNYNDIFALQRVPITPHIQDIKNIGTAYKYFLITNDYPTYRYAETIQDGPITFYPEPSKDFVSMKVLKQTYWMSTGAWAVPTLDCF